MGIGGVLPEKNFKTMPFSLGKCLFSNFAVNMRCPSYNQFGFLCKTAKNNQTHVMRSGWGATGGGGDESLCSDTTSVDFI